MAVQVYNWNKIYPLYSFNSPTERRLNFQTFVQDAGNSGGSKKLTKSGWSNSTAHSFRQRYYRGDSRLTFRNPLPIAMTLVMKAQQTYLCVKAEARALAPVEKPSALSASQSVVLRWRGHVVDFAEDSACECCRITQHT